MKKIEINKIADNFLDSACLIEFFNLIMNIFYTNNYLSISTQTTYIILLHLLFQIFNFYTSWLLFLFMSQPENIKRKIVKILENLSI